MSFSHTRVEKYPEVAPLLEHELENKQCTFDLDHLPEAGKVFRGTSPSDSGKAMRTAQAPEGVPIEIADPRPEEPSPGLDPELLELVQTTAEIELGQADEPVRS